MNRPFHQLLGFERKVLRQHLRKFRWTLRDGNALGGNPFWEAKRGLQIEFVHCRLHIDVERRSVSCELRAYHTGQPLNGDAQVFGVRLLQFNRDCDVEQPAFPFLKVLCPMRE